MAENSRTIWPASPDPMIAQLGSAFDAVGELVAIVHPDQWSAPTPCLDWNVRQLVEHLIGMNRVFTALLIDATTPHRPTGGHVIDDPAGAYRDSAGALLDAFSRLGALEREYVGPLGSASGSERLQIRLYDLLAHGWDLAQATDQPANLPDNLAERSLHFVRTQLTEESRAGRFGPATAIRHDARAIERLVAFLGRAVPTSP